MEDFEQQVSKAYATVEMLRQEMTHTGPTPYQFDKWNYQGLINIENIK